VTDDRGGRLGLRPNLSRAPLSPSKGLDFEHQNPTYPLDQCANFLIRACATVSTLAHRHASSDGITQRSSGKAAKWRFQSTFERPVRRGNDFNRVRTPRGKHVLHHLLAATFIHRSLHWPSAAHEAIEAWLWHRWYNSKLYNPRPLGSLLFPSFPQEIGRLWTRLGPWAPSSFPLSLRK